MVSQILILASSPLLDFPLFHQSWSTCKLKSTGRIGIAGLTLKRGGFETHNAVASDVPSSDRMSYSPNKKTS